MCTVRHRNEEKDYSSLDVLKYLTNKTTLTFFNENYPKKLRYQIVRFIMLVPNCPGAKLSILTMLVPNCPFSFLDAKLSVCLLGAKVSVFTILVQIVRVPNCPSTLCHSKNQCFFIPAISKSECSGISEV